ncbi:MAG: protein jag [Oscillospiraceae bacterium]|jgi:spoIIIJ-associated protein|nr:protein jag [Oscillospiraceae bacterium]
MSIFTGKTLEAAKAAAVQALGGEISINIVQEPKKGLFGKPKGEWRISAEPSVSEENEAVADIPEDKISKAAAYIKNIFKHINIEVSVTGEQTDDLLKLELESPDAGMLIGRKGEHLDSLQYLVNVIVNKNADSYTKVILDSGGYRAKREQTLRELAQKASTSVLKTGHSSAFEPMNPYERAIIHTEIAELEGVYSRSVGNEPIRRVIVYPVNANPNPSRRGPRERDSKPRSPRKSGEVSSYKPYRPNLKTSFETEYKRSMPEKKLNEGLYGKIEF